MCSIRLLKVIERFQKKAVPVFIYNFEENYRKSWKTLEEIRTLVAYIARPFNLVVFPEEGWKKEHSSRLSLLKLKGS